MNPIIVRERTGASNTTLSRSVLEARGYKKFTKGTTMRQTLTGNVLLDKCVIQDFALDGFVPQPTFIVDVAENTFKGFDGLLGMDYIYALDT